ncbi:hypothetical protein CDA63_01740 [Hymenobacter amundsenii]|uniref:Uncharacterized protein n=1 Tax=Hymenobacter amundsenii TaxID=2006685 RepID=A0A246FQT6_9BACT|nr:hypothetical protein [Hymenobacter amundsenii]OWP65103.1 hypothetical protein CDA63_01740 [Hymenobacter amundsenii]
MLKIFPNHHLYIKIYSNEIEVVHLQKNQSARAKSSRAFSTDRMLLADFHVAEEFLRSVIRGFGSGKQLFSWSHTALIQQMIDLGGGLCEVEKRTLRDLCEHTGAKYAFIVPHTDELSNEQALQKLTLGLKGGAFMPPDLSW